MPDDATRKPSLTMIAQRLGISAKTVSNAFNHPDQLSAELRQRILEMADALGYAGPDPLARAFRHGRSRMIGVAYGNRLSYAFADPAAVAFLAGVSEVLEPEGYGLVLIPGSAPDNRDLAGVRNAMIDGVIAYSLASDDPVLDAIHERGVPMVAVDQPHVPNVPWIGIDDREGGRLIASHLVERGHRRIGIISFGMNREPNGQRYALGDLPHLTYEASEARLAGYADVLLGRSDIAHVPVLHMRDSTEEEGAEGAHTLLQFDPQLTSWICLSDRLAKGAMAVARDAGRDIPDTLAVAAFDDVYQEGAISPPLTTIRQPHHQKGTGAAHLLLQHLNGQGPPEQTMLPIEMVIRESTAGSPR